MQAAEQISGVRGALMPVTNTGCDRGTLEDRVRAAVGGGPAVVFVDLSSGSCIVRRPQAAPGGSRVTVVTGVNLAMLVDFLFHRSLSVAEAAARAAEAGGSRSGFADAIVLCRIDDRLVHGQVVIGWGRAMGIELIILVDDTVAASAWEQELYRMAVSPEIEVLFVTVADARPGCKSGTPKGARGAGVDRRSGDHGGAPRRRPRRRCSKSIWGHPPPAWPP